VLLAPQPPMSLESIPDLLFPFMQCYCCNDNLRDEYRPRLPKDAQGNDVYFGEYFGVVGGPRWIYRREGLLPRWTLRFTHVCRGGMLLLSFLRAATAGFCV